MTLAGQRTVENILTVDDVGLKKFMLSRYLPKFHPWAPSGSNTGLISGIKSKQTLQLARCTPVNCHTSVDEFLWYISTTCCVFNPNPSVCHLHWAFITRYTNWHLQVKPKPYAILFCTSLLLWQLQHMKMQQPVAPPNYATFWIFLKIFFSALLLKHALLQAEILSSLKKKAGVLLLAHVWSLDKEMDKMGLRDRSPPQHLRPSCCTRQ